jgi:predicted HTH transcriptional regulator
MTLRAHDERSRGEVNVSDDYSDLVVRLTQMPTEAEWLEFKVSNDDAQMIGQLLSGLSNAAALHRRERAFIVWGIDDQSHEIVGTDFLPRSRKVGSEELENWLTTQLEPRIHFWIREVEVKRKRCVVFEVEPAPYRPVSFRGVEYIRVGTYNKRLAEHPEKEKLLWRSFERESFETAMAAYDLSGDEVFEALHVKSYLGLSRQQALDTPESLLERLADDALIKRSDSGVFHITNLGAILFAQNIEAFPRLTRKTVRVIFYKGADRTESEPEVEGRRGYASGFSGLVDFLVKKLPQSEEIKRSLRIPAPMYPEIALRELIANALIHQDFEIAGSGPMIEVFSDRIEITNPGTPLIDVARFLDMPPRSRNEKLARLMRRLGICEERGSGIDRVVKHVEIFQLPAPDFQVVGDHTKVVLFGPKAFADMTKAERVRACYQHAALRCVSNQQMTNESLRKRFGFQQPAQATRVITDTLAAGLIKVYDPSSASKRHAKYVPFWA